MSPQSDYESREDCERRNHWKDMWSMLEPPPGVVRKKVFHVGLVTFVLALMVGFPLGSMVAVSLFGQPGLGGIIGIFLMMLVFGFINQRLRDRGTSLSLKSIRMPGFLRGGTVWFCALAGAIGMAVYGAGFAAEIGAPAEDGAVGLGFIGFAGGLVLGMIVRAVRRRG
jgi:hypothetical protein